MVVVSVLVIAKILMVLLECIFIRGFLVLAATVFTILEEAIIREDVMASMARAFDPCYERHGDNYMYRGIQPGNAGVDPAPGLLAPAFQPLAEAGLCCHAPHGGAQYPGAWDGPLGGPAGYEEDFTLPPLFHSESTGLRSDWVDSSGV
ncbi:hypothetical protein DXG01_002689 [Tephrocybe rancida]|nr:hypothetical protein DXG01_002689 [Tephrocybe rancida]